MKKVTTKKITPVKSKTTISKMKTGGKIKRYQDAGRTDNSNESSNENRPTPMSKEEYAQAKKAKRQQNRLNNMGTGDKLTKAGILTGLLSSGIGLISQIKGLKEDKKGGTIMKKGGAVPKGYHKMANGSIMKNTAHKKSKKK